MGIPEYSKLADALLCFIYFNGGGRYEVRPAETYKPLADYFGLSQKVRTAARPDGHTGSLWHNRVQWTRQKLINEGYLNGQIRGIWKLTPQGINKAVSIKNGYS